MDSGLCVSLLALIFNSLYNSFNVVCNVCVCVCLGFGVHLLCVFTFQAKRAYVYLTGETLFEPASVEREQKWAHYSINPAMELRFDGLIKRTGTYRGVLCYLYIYRDFFV